ncbi:restriction endonuclease subunit S [Flavobacterium sp.]|uniref:restriction endonuclease subunit S n=1 Tax=Flavobacterium sp. TaxID=239 RepID=UPI0022C4B47A|nr:restriction endonuclease subunit S [Flavobacterium sp.]MCZ8089226.1 restriction endonuclease subunit S [Flavobacterium sp.]
MDKKLPKDWKWVNLCKVVTFHQGYGFPKDLQGNKIGEYPFYKVGDISKNVKAGSRNLISCDNFIDESILLKLKAKPYPINTIVFAKIGEGLKLNRRGIIKTTGIVDNNAMGLKAIENLCHDLYLYHFFNTVKLEDYSKATTVPSVRKSEIEEIPFPLPPLETQQAIVSKIEELFSELDKGIEDLKTAQQQLKTYRQSVLKWAFEGKLTNENVKDGELPKGWEWTNVKDISSLLGDGLHGTPKYDTNGEYYFINGNNLNDGKIEIKENTKKVSKEEFEKYKKQLNDKTIFVSINGSLGYTAFYNNEPVILGKSACYFNVKEGIDKHYIRYIFTSQRFTNYSTTVATGSTIKNVSLKSMREFEIPLPPTLEEQNQIVQEIESRLSVADKMEESIAQSLQQAEALRQSILKKAFSGELV